MKTVLGFVAGIALVVVFGMSGCGHYRHHGYQGQGHDSHKHAHSCGHVRCGCDSAYHEKQAK